MALTFTQTDTEGGQCTTVVERLASVGGAAGSTPVSVTVPGSGTARVLIVLSVPGGTSGDAGTWTPRLNITTANMNLTIEACGLYDISNAPTCTNFGAQASLGGDTTPTSLGTTGVKTWSISASAYTAGSNPLCVYFNISNSSMSDQSFSFTPNQNIDSPFTEVTPHVVTPGAGAISLTGQTPNVVVPYNISVGAGAITASGQQPSLGISSPAIIPVPAGAINVTLGYGRGGYGTGGYGTGEGWEPTLQFGFGLPAGAIVFTGQQPVTGISYRIAIPAGSITLIGQLPVYSVNVSYAPGVGAITLTGQLPALGISYWISVGSGAITLAGVAPNASIGFTVQPGAGAITVTGQQPEALSSKSFLPDAGSVVLSGQTPALSLRFAYQPANGVITLEGQAPIAKIAFSVQPATGVIALSGVAPALSIGIVAQPAAGAISVAGLVPSVGISYRIEVAAGSVQLSAQTPAYSMGIVAQPGAGGISLTGPPPVNAATSIRQVAFRWRNDDGNETTASYRQAENANDTVGTGVVVRLRVQLDATLDAPAGDFQLEFRKVGDTDWQKVIT